MGQIGDRYDMQKGTFTRNGTVYRVLRPKSGVPISFVPVPFENKNKFPPYAGGQLWYDEVQFEAPLVIDGKKTIYRHFFLMMGDGDVLKLPLSAFRQVERGAQILMEERRCLGQEPAFATGYERVVVVKRGEGIHMTFNVEIVPTTPKEGLDELRVLTQTGVVKVAPGRPRNVDIETAHNDLLKAVEADWYSSPVPSVKKADPVDPKWVVVPFTLGIPRKNVIIDDLSSPEPGCECGGAKLGYPRGNAGHSSWCPWAKS